MLGDRITNQDEEEVEEELAALAAEMAGPLPTVPDTELPEQQVEEEPQPSRVKQKERQAMLAS